MLNRTDLQFHRIETVINQMNLLLVASIAFVFVMLVCEAYGCTTDTEPTGSAQFSLASLPPMGAVLPQFVVLAGSTVTSSGPSILDGDVGVWAGSAIVGFPPATLTGDLYCSVPAQCPLGNGPAMTAQGELTVAYNDAAGQPCGTVLTGVDLGGMTLQPGVYCFSTSAQITGNLTLDGMGDPNSIFVFQIGSTLTTAPTSSVIMIASGNADRVFWQVGSSATLGTGTQFSGNILAMASITMTTGTSLDGRALARTGAVTIDTVNGAIPVIIPPVIDAGMDLGPADLGTADAGADLGMDFGEIDAGEVDIGLVDSGLDSGEDLGVDAGMPDLGEDSGSDLGQDLGTISPADLGLDTGLDSSPPGGLSGGALGGCSVSSGHSNMGTLFVALLGLAGLAFAGRRKRLATIALIAAGTLLAFTATSTASAQDSVQLNQFRPAPVATDGFAISRPTDLGHSQAPSGILTLEYANDPLVFEGTSGRSSTEQEAIVANQLVLHANVAIGFANRLVLFAGASGNLMMNGEGRVGSVPADGAGINDVELGARVRLVGTPTYGKSTYAALGFQTSMTLPVARWISPSSHLSGDADPTVSPELLAEFGGRRLRITTNVGARFRTTQIVDTLTIGHELTFGLGIGVPLVGKSLELNAEVFGSTALLHPLEYTTTPVEALAGLRFHAENGWSLSAAAGPGLARGYGSPDFRTLVSVSWSEPEAIVAPATPIVYETPIIIEEAPPVEPEVVVTVAPAPAPVIVPAEIVINQRVEFDTDDDGIRSGEESTLEEIRLILVSNPQLTLVSVDGHADERASDSYNMALSQRRAETVCGWLMAHGISIDRLEAHGYGEREPLVSGVSPEAQQKNRNVQFFVLVPVASHPAR